MAATVARGSHNINSMYMIKSMLRKAYHNKGGVDIISDAVKLNNGSEEVKSKEKVGDYRDGSDWWVPDHRTGIYYPKGQEKVIGEVPVGKDFGVNWFSNQDDYYFS